MTIRMAIFLAAALLAGPSVAGTAPTTFSVKASVTGLTAPAVLQNNGKNDLPVSTNGTFAFSTRLASGQPFSVTVRTQPSYPAQGCSVSGGSGTVGSADVTVTVACKNLTIPRLVAVANVHRATMNWNQPSDAMGYDLYTSSAPNCDVRNYTSCPDGALFPNVTSPRLVTGLPNDQARYFILETRYKNGARGLSNEAGARPSGIVFGGFVHAITAMAQNKILVGGAFRAAGIASGSAVPIERDTGQAIVGDFPIVSGNVFAIESDLHHGFYLGGTFTAVAGVPRVNLAHVLPDGSVDPNFNPAPNGTVRALAYVKGRLYVGGGFTTIGGVARTGLAALTSTDVVPTWNPVFGSFNPVFTLAGVGDRIFVGGSFSTVNGQQRRSLAAFNLVNAADQPGALSPWTADANGQINDLLIANGKLYVGGSFITIGTQSRNNLAAFSLDTVGNPTALLPLTQPAFTPSVSALALSGTTLYLGLINLTAVDADSGAPIRTLTTTGGGVAALITFANKLYVAGSFQTLGGVQRLNLAAIDPATGTVLPWNPSPNHFVFALSAFYHTVYAGGAFSGINAVPRARLAQLDADGLLTAWNPSADAHVLSLAASPSGQTAYVGGYFTTINGLPHVNLAAIDANGVAIESFNHPSTSTPLVPGGIANPMSNRVNAIVLQGDKVFAGGWFNDGIAAYYAADAISTPGVRLNWFPQTFGGVETLAIGSNQLYVGGSFTGVGATGNRAPRQRLAAFALDAASNPGVLLPLWNPPADSTVRVFSVLNSILYLGGDFLFADGVPHSRLAAFDSTSLLQGWQPGANAPVYAMANLGNTILASGDFTVAASTARPFLASINPNATINAGFNANPDGGVYEVAVAGNNAVYVAGAFTNIGGKPRNGFARLNATGAAD